MKQAVLIGLISLSCICIFFIYQNIKLKRMYTEEFNRINKNMGDMTRLFSLNAEKTNVLSQSVDVPQQHSIPSNENDSKYNKLKNNYEEYVRTNFEPYEFENVPEEVKEGIENLTGEGYVEEPLYIGEEHVLNENENENENENFSSEVADESGTVEEESGSLEFNENLGSEEFETLNNNFDNVVLEEVEGELLGEGEGELLGEGGGELLGEGGGELLGEGESNFSENLQLEEFSIVNEVVNSVSQSHPVVVEPTFSVNDNNDLEFEESHNVDLENFAKSKSEELENMTLKELQQLARENNIVIKGRKNELIVRLKEKLLVN
jgi:hypothetical protein